MDNIQKLAKEFKECQKVITAIGDENRLHLIIKMMQMGECDGVRVGEITEKSHLSRPAVSHHLQILKDAGILAMREDGTKNFYYFDHDLHSLKQLRDTLDHAIAISTSLQKNH